MRELYRQDGFAQTYAQTLGMNMLRINLWPTVSPRRDDPEAIRYQDFDFTGQGERLLVFIDFARRLKAQDADALLIGTVWSPPAWMKVNRRIVDDESGAIDADSYANRKDKRQVFDNRLDMDRLPHFANWLVEMARLFEAEGVPLDAISIANEPAFTQWFESCVWTAEDYARATQAVGEALEAAAFEDILLFGPETMTGFNWPAANPLYIDRLMEDEAVARHLDVFATHGYSDGFNADNTARSSWEFARLIRPHGRPYWVTEGGTGGHEWPQPLNGMAMSIHNALVHGNASAVVPWQVSEGEPSDGALMVMDELTKKSHVARHWFAAVRPGAVRVEATPSEADGLHASAFAHDEEGTLTLVVFNTAETDRDVRLSVPEAIDSFDFVRWTSEQSDFRELDAVDLTAGSVELTLPAQSVVTLQSRQSP